ncbi:MAG: methyl-accepting chemotaxis protein, partial [Leptolyngbyaceae cyanobacterium bins.59]|nr:methyl-accepting chemotaxis protein [Leptolyngbyaceae cyanobacterium bins.59]
PLPTAPVPPPTTPVFPTSLIPLKRPTPLLLPQGLRTWWGNLNFGPKLLILLFGATVIPVVAVTQTSVLVTQWTGQQQFNQQLQGDLNTLEEEYILAIRDDSLADAETLAGFVELNQINPNDPKQVSTNQVYLTTLVQQGTTAEDRIRAGTTKSFWILTNAQGKTIAQSAKTPQEKTDDAGYPLLPEPGQRVKPEDFDNFITTPGISLGELAIVKQALQTNRPVSGVELIPWNTLNLLGLGVQASVWSRTEAVGAGSREGYQPGLAAMAVHPIRDRNQRLQGMAIVGILFNRSHALVDYAHQNHQIPTLSIYSGAMRISTNVPFTDNKTRAIGTFLPDKIKSQVLEQGQEATGTERINHQEFRVLYRPLYDHRRSADRTVKPVGLIAVGRPLTELQATLVRQQFIGFAIGGVMLLLAGGIAIPIANAFAFSLRNLARFAQQIGSGAGGTRLETSDRTDEIGILARELNDMASSIETNMQQMREQEEQERQEAERQRREKERLQSGVVELLLQIEGAQKGDLTVQAPVTAGEVGSIADAFNATIRSLRQIVMQVKVVTSEVNNLAQRSELSVRQLSQEALQQSSQVTHALASVSAIASLSQQMAHATQETAAIAQQTAAAAHEGDGAMEKTVVSMDKIRTAVGNTAKRAKRLAESSQEISQILALISGISERANLLAFNAAIEAARAGEKGQGFKQVAEEVRGLAQQVTDSARDIELLISGIQKETAAVLNGMESGTSEVVVGTQLIYQTQEILQGLTALSQQINQYMQGIALNTVDQTQASQQVNQTMEQVAQVARQTSDEAQTVVSSLQELVNQVETLEASVAQFQVEHA